MFPCGNSASFSKKTKTAGQVEDINSLKGASSLLIITRSFFNPTCGFKRKRVYLPMDVDDRAQEAPCSTLPVHVEHSQDLQEANPSGKSQRLKADIVRAWRYVCRLCEWVFGLQQSLWESIFVLQVFLFPLSWRRIRAAFVSPGSHWPGMTSALFIDHFCTSCTIYALLFFLFLGPNTMYLSVERWRCEIYHKIIRLKAPLKPFSL